LSLCRHLSHFYFYLTTQDTEGIRKIATDVLPTYQHQVYKMRKSEIRG
jgi:hypothetical protein